jgi:hypothetical protein
MTGSLLFNRQHSSTAGYSNKNKMTRPKLRRCSSADDYNNSFEIIPDENKDKEKISTKHDPTASDCDSGIEDFDQHIINYVCSQSNNNEEEESSPVFGACEDEDSEGNLTPTPTPDFENSEPYDLQRIYNDRKSDESFKDVMS